MYFTSTELMNLFKSFNYGINFKLLKKLNKNIFISTNTDTHMSGYMLIISLLCTYVSKIYAHCFIGTWMLLIVSICATHGKPIYVFFTCVLMRRNTTSGPQYVVGGWDTLHKMGGDVLVDWQVRNVSPTPSLFQSYSSIRLSSGILGNEKWYGGWNMPGNRVFY